MTGPSGASSNDGSGNSHPRPARHRVRSGCLPAATSPACTAIETAPAPAEPGNDAQHDRETDERRFHQPMSRAGPSRITLRTSSTETPSHGNSTIHHVAPADAYGAGSVPGGSAATMS